MKYCQVIDQSIRALDELKDTLETSKKPILPESQNACSDFLSYLSTATKHQTTVLFTNYCWISYH